MVRGTNAETRFAALAGTGHRTPNDRFFVLNHTATPVLDTTDWTLTIWGDGLTHGRPVEFGLDDLKTFPACGRTAFVECAGNGRSFFTCQQGQTVSGTAWTLGAIGTARWRGVRLGDVLRRAGIGRHAVDVLPRGLDAEVVTDGVNLGGVRRPLPVAKALDDVLLAYEMNGEPLPPDHGYPVRVIAPSWVGIANIKWVGDIEVSAEPLLHPVEHRPLPAVRSSGHPPEGSAPLTRQTLKSAFELAQGAVLALFSPYGADRPFLVGRRAGEVGGGQHRRRSALAAGPAALRAPGRGAGCGGRRTGCRRRRARRSCWPGPRTGRGVRSRRRRRTTRRGTCSTRWCGTR
ncbi:hypothetical protein SFUMM280S_04885 [Streptomyces fumanus]